MMNTQNSLMNRCMFSIVVPIYNISKYLSRCIDSILTQTYSNFELILVNDGSTDNCLDICEEYALHDNRIQIVNQKNKGLFLTRREGLKKCKGDYILHIDGDDKCDSNLLSSLYSVIKNIGPDCIIYNYSLIDENDCFICQNDSIWESSTLFLGNEMENVIRRFLLTPDINNIWNKCARRELCDIEVDYSSFNRINMGEDAINSTSIIKCAKSVYYLNASLYYYRINQNGLTRSPKKQHLHDYIKCKDFIFNSFSFAFSKEDYIETFLNNYIKNFTRFSLLTMWQYTSADYDSFYSAISNSIVFDFLRSHHTHLSIRNKCCYYIFIYRATFFLKILSFLYCKYRRLIEGRRQ